MVGAVLATTIGLILKGYGIRSAELYTLTSLPGELWLSSLKLFVLPLISAQLVCAVSSLALSPAGPRLAARMVGYYASTSGLAMAMGLLVANTILLPTMSPIPLDTLPEEYASTANDAPSDELEAYISTYVAAFANASLSASPLHTAALAAAEAAYVDAKPGVSIPQQIANILQSAAANGNIVDAASTTNLLGVVAFSIVVGLAAAKTRATGLLALADEVTRLAMWVLARLVVLTPLGVASLLIEQTALIPTDIIARYLGTMLLSVGTALAGHALLTLPLALGLLSPLPLLTFARNISPVLVTAFGTSSSAATLPTTIAVAVDSFGYPENTVSLIASTGAACNMDSSAIKYTLISLWMAVALDLPDKTTISSQIFIGIVATVTSMGAAPIPTAGVALWVVVLEGVGIPVTGLLGLVFAVEFLVDRFETVVNVLSDSVGVCILAPYVVRNFPPSPSSPTLSAPGSSSSYSDSVLSDELLRDPEHHPLIDDALPEDTPLVRR